MFEKTDVQIDKYFVVMAMPELNGSYSYGHTICSDEFWEDNKEEVTYTCQAEMCHSFALVHVCQYVSAHMHGCIWRSEVET